MLFSHKIDDEIKLVFLQTSMAQELSNLIIADADYLSQWLPWVGRTKKVADSEAFIKESTEAFAAQKTLNVAIYYNDKIVGISGYNNIHADLKKWSLAIGSGQNIKAKAL